jgi:prepilin-type N-terminal cleavage/methylation domain-containing protein
MIKKHDTKKMKKGFTIIEIVIVIAIIGAMMAIFGNKLFGFFEKADMQTTLNTDADMLFTAATNYKNSSPLADNTYQSITAEQLSKYVSDKMKFNTTTKELESLGLNGGCSYSLAQTPGDTNSYFLRVDCTDAMKASNWAANSNGRMQDIFEKAFKERTAGTVKVDQDCVTTEGNEDVGNEEDIGATLITDPADAKAPIICLTGLK